MRESKLTRLPYVPRPSGRSQQIGARCGRLVVLGCIGYAGEGSQKMRVYLCRCDCGALHPVRSNALASKQSKSCGCLRQEMKSRSIDFPVGTSKTLPHVPYRVPESGVDITGTRKGRLTVLGLVGAIGHGSKGRTLWAWLCECDCGRRVVKTGTTLSPSQSNSSCGCYRRERSSENAGPRLLDTEIGPQSSHPLYFRWHAMISRCSYPSAVGWSRYGGRGISVCDRWKSSFSNFVRDVGDPPSSKHQLDRIDNSGNYEPDNVRWTSPQINNQNRRDNVLSPDVVRSIRRAYDAGMPISRITSRYAPAAHPATVKAAAKRQTWSNIV